VHPVVIEAYLQKRLAVRRRWPHAPRGLRPEERSLLSILQHETVA
jgi:hypothetical protein